MISPRTKGMLASLVVGMSATAGALAWLEPPIKPADPGASVSVFGPVVWESRLIRQTDMPIEARRWRQIDLYWGTNAKRPARGPGAARDNRQMYHFIVDGGGHVWMGDPWRIQRWCGQTERAIQVLLLGDSPGADPTQAQFRGTARLVYALCRRCRIDPEAVAVAPGPRGAGDAEWVGVLRRGLH